MPVSEFVAGEMARLPVARERIVTVLNGIDAADFRRRVVTPVATVRRSLGLSTHDFVILMVGNVREWKGQHVLISALARLGPELRTRTRALIVGAVSVDEQEYSKRLHEIVRNETLGEQVLFLGSRSDIPDLMNAADVVVHASIAAEPFGLVLLEAMAVAKPVLAPALGGPLEIVTPGSGLLYAAGDPDALAGELRRLMEDEALRRELGRGALERVRDFSLGSTVAGIEAVWERACTR